MPSVTLTPADTTWTVPANMVPGSLYGAAWGEGGRGLNGTAGNGGGSGGGGAYAGGVIVADPGMVLGIVIGAGSGQAATEVQAPDTTTLLSAAAGGPGFQGLAANSVGDIKYSGGSPLAGTTTFGAGGSGSAFNNQNGAPVLSRAGSAGQGFGGDGANNIATTALPGNFPGGGGGGGYGTAGLKNGANGAAGKLVLTWDERSLAPWNSLGGFAGIGQFPFLLTSGVKSMVPTQAIWEKSITLLGSDSTTLNPAAALKIILVKAAFTPALARVVADLIEADFTGYGALTMGTGAWLEGIDPATGDAIITAVPPATGYRWETTGTTILNTIYGWAVVDNTKATLYGCQTLPTPIQLTAINQQISLGPVTIRQLTTAMM